MDHDDELAVTAVESCTRALAAEPDIDYLYTDEDKIDLEENHSDPFLKPDWSPERMRSQMYTCHFSIVRRTVLDAVGRLRPGYDGSQDWDLVLRVTEQARQGACTCPRCSTTGGSIRRRSRSTRWPSPTPTRRGGGRSRTT